MEGGLHSAAAYSALENRAYGSCVANDESFVVEPGTGMNLDISTGDGLISVDDDLARRIQTTAVESVAVSAASASFDRIDTVVAYIDTEVTPTTEVIDNINDILMFACVPGTASGSPTAPSDATIQATIGAGNPYMALYDVLVPEDAVNTTGVTLTDRRNVLTSFKPDSVPNGAIDANMVNIGSDGSEVTAFQATSSSTYTDLATVGPEVTIDVPASGRVLVMWAAQIAAANGEIGLALSGANTASADLDNQMFSAGNSSFATFKLIEGLTPGATTFRMKYKTDGTSKSFGRRKIAVIPI